MARPVSVSRLAGVALLVGLSLSVACRGRQVPPAAGPSSFSFRDVELRADRPGLRLLAVDGRLHESHCEWRLALSGAGGEGFSGDVAVTLAFRSRGEQRFLRLTSPLDLGPGDRTELSGITRPARPVDGVDWVHVRYLRPLTRTPAVPEPVLD